MISLGKGDHMEGIKCEQLFNLDKTIAKDLFRENIYPWKVLGSIKDEIIRIGKSLSEDEYDNMGNNIWVAKTANIAPSALINGPAIIDKNAEIRHCAYIRGSVIVGENAVVGNSCEIKNAILFNKVQVPHFNYVGDSILGYKAHMGAGAITSNVKSNKSLVVINIEGRSIYTGLKKFGAIIGDGGEVGSNAVLNPGTIIGKKSVVYPLSMVRGFVPSESIYKNTGEICNKY